MGTGFAKGWARESHETAGRQLWNVAMIGITDNLEKFKKFSQTFDVKRLT